jgi:hypothetical protein
MLLRTVSGPDPATANTVGLVDHAEQPLDLLNVWRMPPCVWRMAFDS